MKTDCSQKQLLNRIDQVSFAVNDMTLYLDTHPCDEKALTYCHELVQERKKLLKEYSCSLFRSVVYFLVVTSNTKST